MHQMHQQCLLNLDLPPSTAMTYTYIMPDGMHRIDDQMLDLREDTEIDHDLTHPPPVRDEKNIWFYWDQGYAEMHPYTKRNVRAYHRRLSRAGWIVRIVDRVFESVSNVSNFLDVQDLNIFPQAYIDGTLTGTYAVQHCSDLVRFPLLIKYGGVYTDVGFMQIGDLDRMWNNTIANPDSPYDVLSYNSGSSSEYQLMNYFLATGKDNPLFVRFHRLLLALWSADGGRLESTGMHKSLLLKGTPMMSADVGFEENGHKYTIEETNEILTDYIIQGQAIRTVMSMADPEDDWNGPEYTSKHVYAIEFMVGSQLINEMTAWDGDEAFRLLSLALPRPGETETTDQAKARSIVEQCLSRSFGFKLAHGLILRVMGNTLGSLWRQHPGSDDIPGTYAHWLRYGMIHWSQNELPPRVNYEIISPSRIGSLTSA